jgi:hypothetical protein
VVDRPFARRRVGIEFAVIERFRAAEKKINLVDAERN